MRHVIAVFSVVDEELDIQGAMDTQWVLPDGIAAVHRASFIGVSDTEMPNIVNVLKNRYGNVGPQLTSIILENHISRGSLKEPGEK